MEADWSVEIGTGFPVIDANWPGFVDLRNNADAVASIAEAADEPALRVALVALNQSGSPLFTSKCDLWVLTTGEIDPDEFGCGPEEGRVGLACWIDVIAREPQWFASFNHHEAWARRATERLRTEPVAHGRIDLVLRSAVADVNEGFGITLYVAGCGVDTRAARAAWTAVLRASVAATMEEQGSGE